MLRHNKKHTFLSSRNRKLSGVAKVRRRPLSVVDSNIAEKKEKQEKKQENKKNEKQKQEKQQEKKLEQQEKQYTNKKLDKISTSTIFDQSFENQLQHINPFSDVEISNGVYIRGQKSKCDEEKETETLYERIKASGDLPYLGTLLRFSIDENYTKEDQHVSMEYLSKNKNFLASIDVLVEKIKKNNRRIVKEMKQSKSGEKTDTESESEIESEQDMV